MEESTLCCFPKEQQPMEREGTCWIRGKMRGGMRTDNPLNCFCGDREIGNESVAEPGKRLVRGVVVLKFCPCFSVSGPTLIRNKINFPQVESVWLMIVTIKWSPHHLHLDQWDCSSYFVLSRWSSGRVAEWVCSIWARSTQCKYRLLLSQEVCGTISAWFMCNFYQLQWCRVRSVSHIGISP